MHGYESVEALTHNANFVHVILHQKSSLKANEIQLSNEACESHQPCLWPLNEPKNINNLLHMYWSKPGFVQSGR